MGLPFYLISYWSNSLLSKWYSFPDSYFDFISAKGETKKSILCIVKQICKLKLTVQDTCKHVESESSYDDDMFTAVKIRRPMIN